MEENGELGDWVNLIDPKCRAAFKNTYEKSIE